MRILLFLLLLPFSVAAQNKLIDSKVEFKVGNMWLNTVKGSFDKATGDIAFYPDKPENSRFNITVSAKTIDTGNDKRDRHLLEEDFFHVDKYPEIRIESESVSSLGDGNFQLNGILTIKGIKEPLECTFSLFEKNSSQVKLTSTFVVDREKFKLGNDYGGFMIEDEIEVEVTLTISE